MWRLMIPVTGSVICTWISDLYVLAKLEVCNVMAAGRCVHGWGPGQGILWFKFKEQVWVSMCGVRKCSKMMVTQPRIRFLPPFRRLLFMRWARLDPA